MPELDKLSVACLFILSCLPNQTLGSQVVALHPSEASRLVAPCRDSAASCGRGNAKLKEGHIEAGRRCTQAKNGWRSYPTNQATVQQGERGQQLCTCKSDCKKKKNIII